MIKQIIIGGCLSLLSLQSFAQQLAVSLPDLDLETAFYFDNWLYETDTFFVAPIYFDSFISFTEFNFNVRYNPTHLSLVADYLTEINAEEYVMVANYMGAADFAMISEGELTTTVFPVSPSVSMLSVQYTGPAIPENFYNSCNGHLMYLAFKKLTPCYEETIPIAFWDGDLDTAFVNPSQTTPFSLMGEQPYTVEDGSLSLQDGTVALNVLSGEVIQNGNLLEANMSGGIQPYSYQWYDSEGSLLDENLFYSPSEEGDYSLQVTDVSGCVFVSEINYTQVAAVGESNKRKMVYPNPVQEQLNILLEGPYSYQLLDLKGSVLQKGKGINHTLLPRNQLETGIYLLQIQTKNEQHNIKISFN